MPVFPSYKNQSIDSHSKSTDTGFYMRTRLALNVLRKYAYKLFI